jgi:dynein heavy chain
VKKTPPGLKQFKEQIDRYEGIYDTVKEMEDSKRFQSWFLVDITPFKMALLNNIKKWSYAFKKHLLEHVVDSLEDLSAFIKGADDGLIGQVVEGDYMGLIKVSYLPILLLCSGDGVPGHGEGEASSHGRDV